jgi:hypothetical protein
MTILIPTFPPTLMLEEAFVLVSLLTLDPVYIIIENLCASIGAAASRTRCSIVSDSSFLCQHLFRIKCCIRIHVIDYTLLFFL